MKSRKLKIINLFKFINDKFATQSKYLHRLCFIRLSSCLNCTDFIAWRFSLKKCCLQKLNAKGFFFVCNSSISKRLKTATFNEFVFGAYQEFQFFLLKEKDVFFEWRWLLVFMNYFFLSFSINLLEFILVNNDW